MQDNSISNAELLKFAVENGIIDLAFVEEKIAMQKREELLNEHPYKIWQGNDGKWRTYLPDKEKGRVLKKRNSQSDIENIVVEYWRTETENPTVEDIFNMWLDEKLLYKEIARGTYDRYQRDFNRFFYDSGEEYEIFNCSKRIKTITEEDLEKFIRGTISKLNLTSKGWANVRTLLYGIFKYAKKHKYTDISITSFMGDLELSRKMFRRADKSKELQVYQEDELTVIIDYLKKNSDDIENLGILLAFQTGMRVGELVALQASDISNTIHVSKTEIRYKSPETGKAVREIQNFPKSEAGDRYIIMTDGAKETVRKILDLNPYGKYLMEKNGKRITGTAFDSKIARICKKLGFPRKSMHKIRKTYGTLLLDNNVDESIVTEQMGHSDISCTRKYYYFCNKNQETKEKQIRNAINF